MQCLLFFLYFCTHFPSLTGIIIIEKEFLEQGRFSIKINHYKSSYILDVWIGIHNNYRFSWIDGEALMGIHMHEL